VYHTSLAQALLLQTSLCLILRNRGTPTAYIKPYKQAAKRTVIQSLKDSFDYSLNPEKLEAVSSYLCNLETAHAGFTLVKG